MTKEEMGKVLIDLQEKENFLREAGQAEYAHSEEEAFSNFMRVGQYLGVDRKKVLLVYMLKHIDGITAFVNGHESQREDIEGRILDARVYLALLAGMVREERAMTPRQRKELKPKEHKKRLVESLKNDPHLNKE